MERTTAGRNERGRRDGERGGRLPLGYRRAGDGLVEVEKEAAAVVRRIFQLRAARLTLRQIADQLNAENVPTSQRGRRWHAASVRAVLLNVNAYRGGERADSPARWPSLL